MQPTGSNVTSRLADFIDANIDAIVDEWVQFAATLSPMTQETPIDALRDHAVEMLARVTTDLRRTQTPAEQKAKSEGLAAPARSTSPAGRHGAQRQTAGLDIEQMMAEFRALRSTVIRLWSAKGGASGPNAFDEVLRFNEAIDQALAESASTFSNQVEHLRQLMLGMVAHDLRGPLNVVNMAAQVLIHSGPLRAQDPSMVRLLRASNRMRALVNDLLDVVGSQLGSGLAVVPAPMELRALVHEVMDEARAEHPQAEFQLQCEADLSGEWDQGRLAQLLSNLLRNAVEHGDPAHPIRCTITETEGGACIKVQNNGHVIPTPQQATIFNALVRGGSSSDPRRNLGLGLYICREIVIGHGGTIEVQSDEANGTVFAVTLPRRASPVAHAQPMRFDGDSAMPASSDSSSE
jgi:signal transduction histidine kinase